MEEEAEAAEDRMAVEGGAGEQAVLCESLCTQLFSRVCASGFVSMLVVAVRSFVCSVSVPRVVYCALSPVDEEVDLCGLSSPPASLLFSRPATGGGSTETPSPLCSQQKTREGRLSEGSSRAIHTQTHTQTT